MSVAAEYLEFVERKSQVGSAHGFEPIELPDCLKPFQTYLVGWALRRGRAAIFADCGMGKTIMQLVWADNVMRHTGKPVMICTPLAVSSQTLREAEKFGIAATRSQDGTHNGGLVITNYERLEHFSAGDFVGIVCDESSILKSIGGQTRKRLTRFMSKLPFRLLCTATAAPNDYVELGTSSEALGELSHSDMLRRFFAQLDDKGQRKESKQQEDAQTIIDIDPSYYQKLAYRVAQTIGQWRLKHHAVDHFWKWVASWARACRMPSDLGFDDSEFVLPELIERDHIINVPTPPGMLFHIPAKGIGEERAERRRTLRQRCEFIANLVDHDRPAVVWCHGNDEADALEAIIPGSVQIAGKDSDKWKEAAIEWFTGNICRCQLNAISSSTKLSIWQQQNDHMDIGRNGIKSTKKSESHNLLNTPSDIARSGENISPPITGQTRKNTKQLQNEKQRKTQLEKVGTDRTQSIENGQSSKSKSGKQPTLASVLISECESTESPSTNTKNCLQNKKDDAQSASVSREEESVQVDCMSITATKRCELGDCFAATAITDSESFETIQSCSEKQCPICGRPRDPHRVLITKPKIASFGINLQHCAHVVTCASHSYEQHYQSVRRCWRFGQQNPVTVDVVATEGEIRVLGNMRRKGVKADAMFSALVKHMQDSHRIERENIYTNSVEAPQWL